MSKRVKWLMILLTVGLLAGIAFLAQRRAAAPLPAGQEPVAAFLELSTEDIATAQAGEIRRVLPLTGALRAVSQAVVKAKVAGEMAEVLVKEGDAVQAGQLLARIDDSDYRARLEERAAALEASRAQARFAEQSRRKYAGLLEKKFISETAYENYQTSADVAERQAQAAAAQLAQARKALEDTRVRAPIAGSISERALQRGDKASIDTRLFTIVDLGKLELEAPVPAAEVPQLALGQEVRVTVEGFGDREFTGSVARINPATQPGTRSILVYVEIPNADHALKAGMFAKGSLVLAARHAKVLVPVTALRQDGASSYVYALAGDRLERRKVVTGLVNEGAGQAEIVEGLAAGDRVVRVNLGRLEAGRPLRLRAPATQP
ncbi:MAG TPA: efflux RND transporter periplasmic adaptor subunit [Candidatus Desulfobacillus sp.]|nr:efflux RND transporter periplasmic adaptor subunit [Candidatus Desulfobacillus sp.]